MPRCQDAKILFVSGIDVGDTEKNYKSYFLAFLGVFGALAVKGFSMILEST
jgi:hypothetical protein